MKIMVVNNTVMVERDKELFIHKETGKFFSDLQQNGNQVYVFQMSMKPESNKNIGFVADYDITNKDFHVIAIKRRKFRLWAYIKTVFKGLQTIRKVDFVYLFYPGHVCSVLALMSMILRKRFRSPYDAGGHCSRICRLGHRHRRNAAGSCSRRPPALCRTYEWECHHRRAQDSDGFSGRKTAEKFADLFVRALDSPLVVSKITG